MNGENGVEERADVAKDGGKSLSKRAFEALALPHLPLLKRLALRHGRREAEADDLVQETFLRAWKYRGSLDPEGNVRAWLCRILVNEAARRAGRPELPVVDVSLSEIEAAPGAAHARLEELPDPELRRALEELPPDFASALVLSAVEGFSYKEIASVQGVPIGTVMSRLFRARQMMRDRLSAPEKPQLKVVR